jgi:Kinesin motor domain
LIQSAFDGYNVCICAYGQTGSGKTHTIIGGDADPGLAPRTFHRIFELANEYSTQFHVHVSIYMLELYNDKLIDLLRQGAEVICIFRDGAFQNRPKMDFLFHSGETGHQER